MTSRSDSDYQPERIERTALLPDQNTLAAFRGLLPNEGVIMQLRHQSFSSRFPWDADADLRSFLNVDSGPDHGFLDEQLEERRQQLHGAITMLLDRVYRYSDPPSKTSSGKFRVFLWWTPFFGQKKTPSLDRAAALKMKESQCLKFAKATHPA
jgi:hypothetical protein